MKIIRPNYYDGSIVNLMASIQVGLDVTSDYKTLPQLPPRDLARSSRVLLIVIDGMGYNFLQNRGPDGFLQHNLVTPLTSVFPATTASAITTFFTGTAPQQHAITGWYTYFRELGSVFTALPFRPRYGRASLPEAGISASRFFDCDSLFARLPEPSSIIQPDYILHSDFSLAHCGPAKLLGYKNLEGFLRTIRNVIQKKDNCRFIYAYWPELDALAHEHGIGSPALAEHLKQLDNGLHLLSRELAGTDTTMIVTADHGLVDNTPEHLIRVEEHPRLAECLVLPLCGEPRAAYCYVHPDRQEQFEDYCRTQFAGCLGLFPSRQLLEEGLFGLGQPHPSLADRIGHYTLVMQENYAIRDLIWGETGQPPPIGVHGGLSADEMLVPLILYDT